MLFQKRNNSQGFTLIEVLISMVILGIVIFAFLNLFGTSFANIFSMGGKDGAMAQASDLMDQLYDKQGREGLDESKIEEVFSGWSEANLDDNFTPNNQDNIEVNITKKSLFDNNGNDGYKVNVTVSYQGGERNVSLTSFFRRSDDND